MQVGEQIDPATLISERWFAAPGKPIQSITVAERFDFAGGGAVAILRVDVEGGKALWRSMPIESQDGRSPWLELLELAMHGGGIQSPRHSIVHGPPPRGSRPPKPTRPPRRSGRSVVPIGKDQSHTSVVVDNSTVLKLYRAIVPPANPEAQLGYALSEDADAPVPEYRGAVSVSLHEDPGRWYAIFTLALAQEFIPDAGDPFEELAERLAAWLRAGAPQRALPSLLADAEPAARATARLHSALARQFGPAPLSRRWARPADAGRWRQRAAKAHRAAVRLLRSADAERAAWLVAHREPIEDALRPLAVAVADWPPPRLQRIHGDLHLGQLLRDGYQFLIGDLEGEPGRAASDRPRFDTPLRDFASMLRSFDHVARSGMRRSGVPLDEVIAGTSAADPAIEAWLAEIRTAFLDAYRLESAARDRWIDIDDALLHALEVEKELYEFGYAATYLPTWMYAPAAGMRWLLDHPA